MSNKSPSATAPEQVMITEAASIAAFNRGPITKYWAPPTTCASTMSYDGNMYYGYGASGLLDTSCYPMGTKKSAEIVDATAWELYYYSPAVCPGGWDVVTKFTSAVPAADLVTSISLGSDTSAALCCPGGFKYTTNGHVCTSALSRGQSIEYLIPSTDIDGSLHLPEPTPSVLPSPSWAFANGVIVMWQSSDLPVLRAATATPSTASASTTNSAQGTTGTGSSSTPSNTSTPSSGASSPESTNTPVAAPVSGGLTTGAKVGIGIGIPLALFIGLAIGWFLFRRRRPYGGAHSPPDYNESGITKYAHTAAMPVHELHAEPPELGTQENEKGHFHRHQLQ